MTKTGVRERNKKKNQVTGLGGSVKSKAKRQLHAELNFHAAQGSIRHQARHRWIFHLPTRLDK
jgi:hypothetical protein